VVIVDDGSTDATAEILKRWRSAHHYVTVVTQENARKGAAIQAAIPHLAGEITVIQDADMEYDPADVPSLIEPIERGVADVVYGSRLKGGRPQRAYLFWHLVGNRFLSLLTSVLYNTTILDMETGYKAFRTDVLRSFSLREKRFGNGIGKRRARSAQPCLGLGVYDMGSMDARVAARSIPTRAGAPAPALSGGSRS
jgi:glycosyltransferase involved in cell wall biosynthesis